MKIMKNLKISQKTEETHRRLKSFMNVSTHKSVGNFGNNLVQHFA